eukprot:12401783-Karenia_brevis.AAC.1
MQQEMSWEIGESYTEEEMNQMPQEMSCEVPESLLVDHPGPFSKPFAEQGFISDKSSWADATERSKGKLKKTSGCQMKWPLPYLARCQRYRQRA